VAKPPVAAAAVPAAKPAVAPAVAAAKPADEKGKDDPARADKAGAKAGQAEATEKDRPAAGDAARKKSVEAAAVKPAPASKAKEPVRPASKASDKDVAKVSRVLPFFVTLFSLAVLGGVGYLVWIIFFGMGSPVR
jgi:hypothetical protein